MRQILECAREVGQPGSVTLEKESNGDEHKHGKDTVAIEQSEVGGQRNDRDGMKMTAIKEVRGMIYTYWMQFTSRSREDWKWSILCRRLDVSSASIRAQHKRPG